jgi:hypothetical protein
MVQVTPVTPLNNLTQHGLGYISNNVIILPNTFLSVVAASRRVEWLHTVSIMNNHMPYASHLLGVLHHTDHLLCTGSPPVDDSIHRDSHAVTGQDLRRILE